MKRANVKRYQMWELNGRGQIVGRWPVPPEHKPDYYIEIEYDEKGVPRQTREWFRGYDKPLVRNLTIENGKLKESRYEDPVDNIQGTNHYVYDERGFLKERWETDPKGRTRYRIEVKCDNRGRFSEEKLFDKLKRLVERHRYYYNPKGQLIKDEVYKGEDGTVLEGYSTFEYDSEGRVKKRTWHDAEGKELSSFAYKYDKFHRMTEVAILHNGKKSVASRFIYDREGKRERVEFLGEGGELLASEEFGDTRVRRDSKTEFPPPELLEPEKLLLEGKINLGELSGVDKKYLSALEKIAYFHLENGRYKESQKLFETLLLLEPENIYYFNGAGTAALCQGLSQTALDYFTRALQRDPQHLPSLEGKAEALLLKGDVEEALKTFEELLNISNDPSNPTIRRAQSILISITSQAS